MATYNKNAEHCLEVFLNETQADLRGLMHEPDATECACRYAWNGDSALNMDPRSWSAHAELDKLVAHVTGLDDFDSWLEREKG